MNKTLLVGFGYKARMGKDVAVNAIVEAYKDQYDIRRYAFGDEMKRELNELDQLELCMRHGIQYDTNPPMDDPLCQTRHGKQRALLQWYGTEYRRAKDAFYWVNKLKARIAEEKPQFALISDVRFANELYYVVANNGITVKINRQGYKPVELWGHHSSENQLDGYKFDYELNVLDGEVEELKKDALTLFGLIRDSRIPNVSALENNSVAA